MFRFTGNTLISSCHLTTLISTIPKDKHKLVLGDIDPTDKMNYASVTKIIDPIVAECLIKYVPGSVGLVLYLKLMRCSILPFVDETLEPQERVQMIWYAIFFLRIWRKYVKESNEKGGLESFITYNTYSCVELNGHSLVNLIVKYQDQPELFKPLLYNSQVCESNFRRLRSMTSTCSTVVNFTLHDLSHKIKRINIQENIISELGKKFTFPREKPANQQKIIIRLPTVDEIHEIVAKARQEALADLLPYISSDAENSISLPCLLEPIADIEYETRKGNKFQISSSPDVASRNEDVSQIITDIHLLLENNVDDVLNLKEVDAGNLII
jgi:hypothetical protein